MDQDELEQAIDMALEGAPRAQQLSQMIETLRERRAGLSRDLDVEQDPAKKREIQKSIAALDKEITTLTEQQAVSTVVEMSVRLRALRPASASEDETLDEDDI